MTTQALTQQMKVGETMLKLKSIHVDYLWFADESGKLVHSNTDFFEYGSINEYAKSTVVIDQESELSEYENAKSGAEKFLEWKAPNPCAVVGEYTVRYVLEETGHELNIRVSRVETKLWCEGCFPMLTVIISGARSEGRGAFKDYTPAELLDLLGRYILPHLSEHPISHQMLLDSQNYQMAIS